MEFVEPEDEPQFRSPPPPDDRLWRHPSEFGAKRPPSSRQVWMVGAASAVGASLLSTGLVLVGVSLLRHEGASRPVERQLVSAPTGPAAAGDVVGIAERARPAIVQLVVDKASSGSGVIFRSDGYLLTNAHVVSAAGSVTVVLSNGRQMSGRVVGTDAESDTAVVKVDGGPYPVATLGSTADLKVGQQAIAIGSPLGLSGGPSVTVGVISALHRTVRTRNSAQSLIDMVQTDAPIAPGSSGGALLDGGGAVIGITTAVAVTEAGTEGFGFATPVDQARSVAEQLITTGRVTTVWLGVEGSDLDGPTASDLNVDGGAMIGQVKSGSPAEQAGLAARDVIVALNGRPVTSMGMLVVWLRPHHPADTVDVEVIRDRQHRTMRVTLGERPPGS
jgi:S1-C subfamily serine protease